MSVLVVFTRPVVNVGYKHCQVSAARFLRPGLWVQYLTHSNPAVDIVCRDWLKLHI